MTPSAMKTLVRNRIEANITDIDIAWPNEEFTLPDTPTSFARIEFMIDDQSVAGFGGGRGSNLYRSPGVIEAHCFVPLNTGFNGGSDLAERFAALFRGYTEGDFRCEGAKVEPSGESGNYWHETAVIYFNFDQLG